MPGTNRPYPHRARWLLALPALLAACATSAPDAPVARPEAETTRAAPTEAPVADSGLYSAEEALQDALSGPLEFIGTGRWPGIERSHACAFRNDRVIVVVAYCTITETQAFRIDVYEPGRGRMRVYAEANGPVSGFQRGDYFSFMVESEPPPAADSGIPALTLPMEYAALSAYEQQRHDAQLPGCYGGEQIERPVGRCFGELESERGAWQARNGAFLERASDDWYRIVRELRALSEKHGMDPK